MHRGLYALAEEATQLYEDARASVAHFIGARSDEIIFTRGTTESINFMAPLGAMNIFSQVMKYYYADGAPFQHGTLATTGQEKRGFLKLIPLHADGKLNLRAARSY